MLERKKKSWAASTEKGNALEWCRRAQLIEKHKQDSSQWVAISVHNVDAPLQGATVTRGEWMISPDSKHCTTIWGSASIMVPEDRSPTWMTGLKELTGGSNGVQGGQSLRRLVRMCGLGVLLKLHHRNQHTHHLYKDGLPSLTRRWRTGSPCFQNGKHGSLLLLFVTTAV